MGLIDRIGIGAQKLVKSAYSEVSQNIQNAEFLPNQSPETTPEGEEPSIQDSARNAVNQGVRRAQQARSLAKNAGKIGRTVRRAANVARLAAPLLPYIAVGLLIFMAIMIVPLFFHKIKTEIEEFAEDVGCTIGVGDCTDKVCEVYKDSLAERYPDQKSDIKKSECDLELLELSDRLELGAAGGAT